MNPVTIILSLLLLAQLAQMVLNRRRISKLEKRVSDAEEGLAELHSHIFDENGVCEIQKLHARVSNATKNSKDYREGFNDRLETLEKRLRVKGK